MLKRFQVVEFDDRGFRFANIVHIKKESRLLTEEDEFSCDRGAV